MELSTVIRRDTLANRPAASAVPPGTLFYQSDKGVLQRSTGSTWEEFGWVPDPGTFTPTVRFGGASIGITYGIQQGQYLAIGPWILFAIQVGLTNKGTSVGLLDIAGFPFTDAVIAKFAAAVQIDGPVGLPSSGIHAALGGATGAIALRFSTGATVTDAHIANTSGIYLTGLYFRSSAQPW